MLRAVITIFILTLIFTLSPVYKTFAKPSYLLCKNQKIVRTIRVVDIKEQERCVTMYTKAGIDRIVGMGNNIWTCNNVLNNIRGNLEKAFWKCKDISDANIEQHYKISK